MNLLAIAGARPNFMKVAPLMREFRRRPGVTVELIHTGQHYDERMSKLFFEELAIPRPVADLGVGSGSHAVQTAEVMKRFEPILLERKPDAVIVVGDVNSTLACALTAAKLGIRVAHVEAGLRSFDRTMPEELNRLMTDVISDWLFVSEPSGVANLRREGISDDKIFLVGNVMIDTLLAFRDRAETSNVLEQLELSTAKYAVLTLHRPSNVDDPTTLAGLLEAIRSMQQEMPVVFPVHPRTRSRLIHVTKDAFPNLLLTEPFGYLDFMKLMAHARLVLTDSGGIQEETTVLGIPCLTLRRNTERPATIDQGTNQLVGVDPLIIHSAVRRILDTPHSSKQRPDLWDGQAAVRISDRLLGSWSQT